MTQKELVASAARTATGNSGVLSRIPDSAGPWPAFRDLKESPKSGRTRLLLNITAASGTTPNLVVTVMGRINGILVQVGTFAAKTAAGQETIVVECCPEHVQLNWTISGTTPSFTFSVQAVNEG